MKGANFSTTSFDGKVSFYKAWFFFTDTSVIHASPPGLNSGSSYSLNGQYSIMRTSKWCRLPFRNLQKRALFGNVKSSSFDFEFCIFEDWMKFRTADSMKVECVNFSGCRFYGDASIQVPATKYLNLSSATSNQLLKSRATSISST
jgi:hypothetical protein